MSFSTIASWAAVGGVSSATTAAANMVGADLEVVSVGDETSATPGGATITDSDANTWSVARTVASGNVRHRILYCANPTVSSSQTVSGNGFATYMAFAGEGYSGAHASPLDQTNGAASGITFGTVSPGSITPTEDNELVICSSNYSDFNQSSTATIDSGFSEISEIVRTGNNTGLLMAKKVQTTAAAVNPAITFSPTGVDARTAIASFKAAAAATGQPYRKRMGGVRFAACTNHGVW